MSNYVPYDEWFENPLDSMPIATDKEELDLAPCEYEPPTDDWVVEEPITMHEKMYRLATQNGNQTIGGSENVI